MFITLKVAHLKDKFRYGKQLNPFNARFLSPNLKKMVRT